DRAARRALGGRPLATRRGAPRADGLPEPSLRPAVRALATGQSRGGTRRRHVEPRARRRDRKGEGLRIAEPPSPVDLLRTRPDQASRAASRYETSLALVWRRRSDSSCTSLSRILLPSLGSSDSTSMRASRVSTARRLLSRVTQDAKRGSPSNIDISPSAWPACATAMREG